MSTELSRDSLKESNGSYLSSEAGLEAGLETNRESPTTAETLPTITQSKFFSPAFNAAIFDGPIRIYFAQYQESEALKIYFKLQEELGKHNSLTKTKLKKEKKNIFLMVYPAEDIFQRAFDADSSRRGKRMACEELLKDTVIGVFGSLDDQDYESIIDLVNEQVSIRA